ncbi:glycosyltransferase family 4 protein [Sinosporangium album]|uniref:glycosyltransferase family 4 protein n=1 Tax=Sinosporangium album TaxID=504805 RepID=UPI0030B81273
MCGRQREVEHLLLRGLQGKGRKAVASLAVNALAAVNRRRERTAPPPSAEQVKILLLHAYGMGGTIRTVYNLAGYLAKDHDVEIVSVLREAEESFFPVPPGVRISFLDDRREPPTGLRRLLARPSRLIPKEEAAYHRFTLYTDLKLARYLRSLRTGVLIATRPGLNLAAAALTPPGVITIGQEHVALQGHAETIQAMIKRRYPKLDALVALTKADLRDYRALLRKKPRRLTRIPNAVPPMDGDRADLSAKTVITVGRMTKIKGFHRLLDAWKLVTEVHPDWNLRIYGAGPQQENLQEQIESLGIGATATLPGSTDDVGSELAKASIFVMSSRHEGFPMTLLEAWGKGLAVVSFNSPHGPKEMITHEHDGLLVKPRTVENLANAIIRVIEDEPYRRHLAANAVRTAETYDLDAVGAQWDALFDELVAPR